LATVTKKPWEQLPPSALATGPALQTLSEEIIAAVRAEVPDYARPLEGAFGEGIRRGVHQALAQFNEMVSEGTGRSVGRRLYVGLGRGEARAGRKLEALLAAYRVGARVAWRRLAAAGLEQGLPPATLVLLAESIFAYIDELSAESAEGYADEMAARAGEADRRRAALVEAMLRTPPAPAEAIAATADEAQWRLPRELAVVAWPVHAGRRPAARLPLGAIAAPVEGTFCALVPDPDGPGRRAELERALDGIPAGLGPAVAPEDAARSHHRASAALQLAEERDHEGLLAADDHRIALLLRADRALVADIAHDRLEPLAHETPRSQERLEQTLLAWLRHEGSVPDTAADLGVHAQTVRYRLTRLRELLGDDLDDPDARFELEAALRATQP
jgi:PucR C-terminal helix-turn-helix domain